MFSVPEMEGARDAGPADPLILHRDATTGQQRDGAEARGVGDPDAGGTVTMKGKEYAAVTEPPGGLG